MVVSEKTHLLYHHDAKILTLDTTVSSIRPFATCEPENQALFKGADPEHDYIITTRETIFHPQGGGQPSDEGTIELLIPAHSPESRTAQKLEMRTARMDAAADGVVLHLLHHHPTDSAPSLDIREGDSIRQCVDAEKRHLYSRLHTAGHVLGSAVRNLLEKEIAGFDELKASHFPGQASCEFQGSIEGKWKDAIQKQVDEYVSQALPVEIAFWTEEDFRREGLLHLIPATPEGGKQAMEEGEQGGGKREWRVVRIVGAGTYPCGGTHVETTDLCGETTVRKITRSKGTSRIGYAVA